LRLARACTGREKIIKFAGCYHGHADMLLVQAGSGVATLGLPDSPGVPAGATANTLTASYNDLQSVQQLFEQYPDSIAGVIVEPVAGNMGLILPQEGFLQGLQNCCRQYGALFILDEVMTGFRAAPGGAQSIWNLDPDITCLGKVIGGGLPVGAYGGKRDIMQTVAPAGTMYQAGTLSGNPLAMTAGLVTLQMLNESGVFEAAASRTAILIDGIKHLAQEAGIPLQAAYIGTMFGFFFLKDDSAAIHDYAGAKAQSHVERYSTFFHAMLEAGIYFAPGQFEAGFMSTAHTDIDIEATLHAVETAFQQIAQG
ncbi:MAG TPA: glutamate-1-semialdehyde 2,1-aminomutase, partial [Aggregatilineales bacterium]|nr:glutamate-1-semialdehyde 2,1-aminomutase [Aggregatilineales bacterium]